MTAQEVIEFLTSKDFIPTWGTILGTFLGAGLGSWTAFELEGGRRKAEEGRRHLAAANHALYIIFQYWSFLSHYKTNFIDPHKESNLIRLINPVVTVIPTPVDKLNQTNLQFILQSSRADLYVRLAVAEMDFNTTMKLIENQNKLLENIDPPILALITSKESGHMSEEELTKILGPHVIYQSKKISEEVVRSVEDSFNKLKDFGQELRKGMIQILPERSKLIPISYE